VAELKRRFKVPVYGPQESRIAEITIAVDQNDIVHLPELCLELIVLKVPGHTLTHIAYHSQTEHWLFCGDTLFGAGCGRLFEGTPSQMYESLQKLASLADNTEVYCAHEYTLANLKFAEAVEQGNAAVRERIANEQAKRSRNLPTVPSSIGLEKATNPFLRCNEPEVQARVRFLNPSYGNDGLAIFTALREWKNVFC
jgi:hydroxyacylglutathione hydrolase